MLIIKGNTSIPSRQNFFWSKQHYKLYILFLTATTDIYFKHISSSRTCSKLDGEIRIPMAECPSHLVSTHCGRLLSEVDVSEGLVPGKQREENGT